MWRDDALRGRCALVTGAAGGLGRAIADRLAALGATVLRADLATALPPQAPAQELWSACDISSDTSVQAAAAQMLQQFGRCDILVNNAAILPTPVPLEQLSAADWDRVINVNLRGAFLCAKYFGAAMLRQGSGSIINIASVAATTPNAVGAYGPSKAAILALTRQIAVEWGARGVRANAVSPGLIRTPMSEHFYQDAAVHATRIAAVASRRIGTPQDIAAVVAFLASDASAYVNGEEIVADGGFLVAPLFNIHRSS